MHTIQYRRGDATRPQCAGRVFIAHICNDIGAWGRGFVTAVSALSPAPEAAYRKLFNGTWRPELGYVQFVEVSETVTVANMIAQRGIRSPRNKTAPAPIRYPAVEAALAQVATVAEAVGASVHMPRIGCGLAGGEWNQIEPIIARTLCAAGVDTFVYDP